jgi:integrase
MKKARSLQEVYDEFKEYKLKTDEVRSTTIRFYDDALDTKEIEEVKLLPELVINGNGEPEYKQEIIKRVGKLGFVRWFDDQGFKVKDLSVKHVQDWLYEYGKKRVDAGEIKPSSYNAMKAALRGFLRWAYDPDPNRDPSQEPNGYIKSLPIIKTENGNHDLNDYPPYDETMSALLAACETPKARNVERDRALVSLMMESGLRRGEIVNLRWADARWGRDSTGADIGNQGAVHVHGPHIKTKYAKRDAPFERQAWELLQEYRASLENEPEPTDWLFLAEQRNGDGPMKMKRSGLHSFMRRISERAGSPYASLRCHDLRHMFGLHEAREKGTPLTDLMVMMGHSNIQITQIYSTPTNTAALRRRGLNGNGKESK